MSMMRHSFMKPKRVNGSVVAGRCSCPLCGFPLKSVRKTTGLWRRGVLEGPCVGCNVKVCCEPAY